MLRQCLTLAATCSLLIRGRGTGPASPSARGGGPSAAGQHWPVDRNFRPAAPVRGVKRDQRTPVDPNEIQQTIVIVAAAMGGLTIVSALARRIAGPYGRRVLNREVALSALAARPDGPALDDLRDELAQLRAEVVELRDRSADLDDLHNRLDFAERMLAQGKDRGAVPGAQS